MTLLFDKADIPRTTPVKRMSVMDAGEFPDGEKCIEFECRRCSYNTGWIYDELSVSVNKRGIPCPKCNETDEHEHLCACNSENKLPEMDVCGECL